MKEGDYCYIHCFGKFRKVPVLKNLTIHTIITAILIPLIFHIHSQWTGATLSNQQIMHSKLKDIEEHLKDNMPHLRNYLKIKYPDGYIIVVANDRNEFYIPPNGDLYRPDKYDIDLRLVRVTKFTESDIFIKMPDITDKEVNSRIRGCMLVALEKKVLRLCLIDLKG